jgi:hypothetical protein
MNKTIMNIAQINEYLKKNQIPNSTRIGISFPIQFISFFLLVKEEIVQDQLLRKYLKNMDLSLSPTKFSTLSLDFTYIRNI